MPSKPLTHSSIYNDLKKIDRNWNEIKPDTRISLSRKEKWVKLIHMFEKISAQYAVVVGISNIITKRFIYAVDKRNVIGYELSRYLANDGLDFSNSNWHADFLHSLLLMQEEAIKYYLKLTDEEKNKMVINYEGMYKRSNGQYFHLLQQTVCLETDRKNQPFLFLIYIHDIGYLKKSGTANFVITTPNEVKLWNFNFDKNCLEPVNPISKQEKKILSYLSLGKSTKEIAKELFISPLTVDKHRRNLLKKTNCIDTTALITYAKLVGLF